MSLSYSANCQLQGLTPFATLLEISLTTVLALIVVSAAMSAMVTMSSSAHLAAQHTAAMCLCQELLETVRAEADLARLRAPA